MPVPIHVPSNRKMPVPYRSYRGSWSNNIDLLGQRVPSRVAMVAWHVTHPYSACNDGSTVSSCTYPYGGGVNVVYESSFCFCNGKPMRAELGCAWADSRQVVKSFEYAEV
jgi:hypothetical protein